MDFPQFVTEHLARMGDDDPTSVFSAEGQKLLDISRQQDLDSRAMPAQSDTQEDDEVKEVDELAEDPSSLTTRSEPAMDSALFTQPESSVELNASGDPEPVQAASIDPSPDAVPQQFLHESNELPVDAPAVVSQEPLSVDSSAPAVLPGGQDAETSEPGTFDGSEDAIPAEFLREEGRFAEANIPVEMGHAAEAIAENPVSDQAGTPANPNVPAEIESASEAIPAQFLQLPSVEPAETTSAIALPASEHAVFNRTTEATDVPEHLQPVFNDILAYADEQIHAEGFQTSMVEPGMTLPPLPAIPASMIDRGSVVNVQSQILMERERL